MFFSDMLRNYSLQIVFPFALLSSFAGYDWQWCAWRVDNMFIETYVFARSIVELCRLWFAIGRLARRHVSVKHIVVTARPVVVLCQLCFAVVRLPL